MRYLEREQDPKPTVTILLSEYENLKSFREKCNSKKMFLFDEYLNVVYFADENFSLVERLEKQLEVSEDSRRKLKSTIIELERKTFIQKLKNLFK